jgi:hypothetical protein
MDQNEFDFAVVEERVNGVKCWKYLGDSLKEAAVFAQKVRSVGAKFYDPLTREVTGVHRAVLDADMVRLLIAMSHYHKYNEYSTMVYPDEFPVLDKGVRGFTGEYAYLVHFGLLRRERDGDVTHYKLTMIGWEFIKGGTKIHRALFNSGAQIHGFDESTERVGVKYFFSNQELEKMQKPLWFLPEKFRQEILTAEELAL